MNYLRVFAIAMICCIPFSNLKADESDQGFILLIDEDAPGAAAMLSGRYEEAIQISSGYARNNNDVAASTVWCASLIASRALDAAIEACNHSVELAERPVTAVYNPRGYRDRAAIAMAFSNRAVLHSIRGRLSAADADLARAREQNRYEDDIAHNQSVKSSELYASAE